ncbi:hypothetical protein P3S68_019232 [Capsicum galapagoense]
MMKKIKKTVKYKRQQLESLQLMEGEDKHQAIDGHDDTNHQVRNEHDLKDEERPGLKIMSGK